MKISTIHDKAEIMNHKQRWKYMINLGKVSQNDLALSKSLRELFNSRIHYERLLAIMSARGSFDEELIAGLLENPSIFGMSSIIKLVAKHLEADCLTDIIPKLSKEIDCELLKYY